MTIEEAIKKATEAGYRYKGIFIFRKIVKDVLHFSNEGYSKLYILEFASIFMDKDFWQKLFNPNCKNNKQLAKWKFKWHGFIDHLADGKTAEDYFKNL